MYTMGSDPEFPVFQNDVPIPVTGLLGGSKDNPIIAGPFGGYQEDNVNAEINPVPSDDVGKVVENVLACKEVVATKLAVHGATIKSVPYTVYPGKLPQACSIAGCDPDYNIYTRKANVPPDLSGTNARSAGGHVLMQVPIETDVPKFVQMCDRTLGLLSTLWDKDTERRALYGKPGSFRARRLGNHSWLIEYRTMSNAWTANEHLIRYVFNVFKRIPELMNKFDHVHAKVMPYQVEGSIIGHGYSSEYVLKAQGFGHLLEDIPV